MGRRHAGCGRGSEHISPSLMASGCLMWAAASGRQRSASPWTSAKAARSSASTPPRECCASPVPTPSPHAVGCALPSAMPAPWTNPTGRSTSRGRNARSSGSPTQRPPSPRWCGSSVPVAASRSLTPIGRRSRSTSATTNSLGWSETGCGPSDIERPTSVGRLHDLVRAAGCVPLARTRGDPDLDDLGSRRVAGAAWLLLDGEPRRRPRRQGSAGDGRPRAVRLEDPRGRAAGEFSMRLTMFAVVAAAPKSVAG